MITTTDLGLPIDHRDVQSRSSRCDTDEGAFSSKHMHIRITILSVQPPSPYCVLLLLRNFQLVCCNVSSGARWSLCHNS